MRLWDGPSESARCEVLFLTRHSLRAENPAGDGTGCVRMELTGAGAARAGHRRQKYVACGCSRRPSLSGWGRGGRRPAAEGVAGESGVHTAPRRGAGAAQSGRGGQGEEPRACSLPVWTRVWAKQVTSSRSVPGATTLGRPRAMPRKAKHPFPSLVPTQTPRTHLGARGGGGQRWDYGVSPGPSLSFFSFLTSCRKYASTWNKVSHTMSANTRF